MKGWKVAGLAAALVGAAGAGAALAPTADAQSAGAVRVQGPRAFQLIYGGSQIGVSIRDVADTDVKGAGDAAAGGAVVEGVSEGSPAEKAGIRKGDVIVGFDGERVRSVRQLTRLVQETPPGRSVPAVVLRDGQRTTVTVTPREGERFDFERLDELRELARDLPSRVMPRQPPAPAAPGAPPAPPAPPAPRAWMFDEWVGGGGGRLGVTISALPPQLAEYFGAKSGVLVTSVRDGSNAARAGLKAGDVITAVDGTPVDEPADVRRAAQKLQAGGEFRIDVVRDRKPQSLKGTFEPAERSRSRRTTV